MAKIVKFFKGAEMLNEKNSINFTEKKQNGLNYTMLAMVGLHLSYLCFLCIAVFRKRFLVVS